LLNLAIFLALVASLLQVDPLLNTLDDGWFRVLVTMRKVHILTMLILSISYFTGSSLAAPGLQRRDDGDASGDPISTSDDGGTPTTTTPVITPTLVQGSPDDGPAATTTTFTTGTSTLIPSGVSSDVAPTPTPTGTYTGVEMVPPVTVLKQLGTSAVVVASQGTTSTLHLTRSSGVPSPTSNRLNQVASSAGGVLKISSSMIAAGLVIGVWVTF